MTRDELYGDFAEVLRETENSGKNRLFEEVLKNEDSPAVLLNEIEDSVKDYGKAKERETEERIERNNEAIRNNISGKY